VTRLLRFLTDLPKTYTGEVVLGRATTTQDASGETVGEWDMAKVSLDLMRSAALAYVGEIQQIPPMVSAVKIDGKRLHALARQGIEVERAARPVTIHSLEVESTDDTGVFAIEVACSSGTYIRTLAADLGTSLGGGAHLRNLRRTAIGSFTLADSVVLEAVDPSAVLSPADALRDYPAVIITDEEAIDVGHGKSLADVPTGPHRILNSAGRLLAVYDAAKPEVVLAAT
jgi:tRNA pseudouridine55 synthase